MTKWLIRRCTRCGNYTLNTDACPLCGGEVRVPHPAKFSPDDRYASYRIALKKRAASTSQQQ